MSSKGIKIHSLSIDNCPMEKVFYPAHLYRMNTNSFEEPFLRKLRQVIDETPGLTIAAVARNAGIDNKTIRSWLDGTNRSPTINSARKVCEALGTTLEEFLSDARTEEEKEIVRLVSQLPADLRRQLLGYGQALAASQNPNTPPKPSTEQ